MVQHELALKSGVPYNGRLVVRADRGVKVTVRLSWGDGQSVSQRVSAPRTWKTRHFRLNPNVDTTNARFEIIGEGKGTFSVGAVSLMPADNIKGFRPDMVALMKEMNCQILRMPRSEEHTSELQSRGHLVCR